MFIKEEKQPSRNVTIVKDRIYLLDFDCATNHYTKYYKHKQIKKIQYYFLI